MNKKHQSKRKPPKLGAIDRFLSLSDAEKERVFQSFDREVIPDAETTPTMEVDRKRWEAFRRNADRYDKQKKLT